MGIRHGVCVTIAVLATAVSLAGCGNAPGRSGPGGLSNLARTPVSTLSAEPYDLYTHCGIREANIDGRWFVASDPVWDGAVNPPSGWGNPYQHGTMTLRSATEAVFTDAAGHRVVFTLRPGATGPLELCA